MRNTQRSVGADKRAIEAESSCASVAASPATSAIEHGLPVVTQDEDYDQIARAHPALQVLKV